MNEQVLIIDYGVGNHQSIMNSLDRLGYGFKVSNKASDIADADSYILPGVGSFGEAMKNIHRLNLAGILNDEVIVRKKPVLGICLGMQIMAQVSEENGHHEGLGWIEGRVARLSGSRGFRVPHIGWNTLRIIEKDPLYIDLDETSNFYFNHSYHFIPDGKDHGYEGQIVTAMCRCGEDVVASVRKDNIFGVQFHPEKSQRCGLKLFRHFFDHIKQRAACV